MKVKKIIIRHIAGAKTNQQEEFNFDQNDQISLGRAGTNNVVFDPELDAGVSRDHAVIVKGEDAGSFFIEDKGSLNGVLVNHDRIEGRVAIYPQDEIQLGIKGPKFVFDLSPRPAFAKATELITIDAATQQIEIEDLDSSAISETPAKQGIGQETLERVIVEERKKTGFNVAALFAGLLLIGGALGYTFRDSLFGTTVVNGPTTVIQSDTTIINNPGMDAEAIAAANVHKLVLIETGWKLVHAQYGDDIYHEYTSVKNPQTGKPVRLPIFLQLSDGSIEPSLGLRRNVEDGEPIVSAGTGTGFVVDKAGYIMTNNHVAAAWQVMPYYWPQGAQQGVLLKNVGGKWENGGIIDSPAGWVPGATRLFGREPISGTTITAEVTYMDVTFAKTSQRTKATITRSSMEHDLAIIKVDLIGGVEPVKFADPSIAIRPGQEVICMGFPGLSPEIILATKNENTQAVSYKTVPDPTLTDGRVSKVIQNTSDAGIDTDKQVFTFQGESYQLTNDTGPGNSGGPIFNKNGEVIGVLNSGRMDFRSVTKFSYAVPAKYALSLMRTQTVIN
jgi:S1-C subfamily serine protease/pSer/pThr/pTyr-binding forkhead associated (FHA) protein